MDDADRRAKPRYVVTLYTEQVEREAEPARILNLSEDGFLIRGDLCAGEGGVIRASFRVRPSAGERRVTARGRVVRARREAGSYEFGVRIESFGSPAEESAYQGYVRELAERGARPSP